MNYPLQKRDVSHFAVRKEGEMEVVCGSKSKHWMSTTTQWVTCKRCLKWIEKESKKPCMMKVSKVDPAVSPTYTAEDVSNLVKLARGLVMATDMGRPPARYDCQCCGALDHGAHEADCSAVLALKPFGGTFDVV